MLSGSKVTEIWVPEYPKCVPLTNYGRIAIKLFTEHFEKHAPKVKIYLGKTS